MTVEDVLSARDQAFSQCRVLLGDGKVVKYAVLGGQDTPTPWMAAGLFCEFEERRLVLEVLLYQTPGQCAVRVYREKPLKVPYSTLVKRPTSNWLAPAQQEFLKLVHGQNPRRPGFGNWN